VAAPQRAYGCTCRRARRGNAAVEYVGLLGIALVALAGFAALGTSLNVGFTSDGGIGAAVGAPCTPGSG